MDSYTIHFDGSCWKNPGGTAAGGYTLHRGGTLLSSGHAVFGTGTQFSNNVAEYKALILGLTKFTELIKERSFLNILGDSKLVVNQMNKKWKINSGLYKNDALAAKQLVKTIQRGQTIVSFDWIPRDKNEYCDELSKIHRN